MRRRSPEHPSRPSRSRPSRLAALVVTVALAGCALGERPYIDETPTAVGTSTGDAAIDAVLALLDDVSSAVFTAEYTALIAFGSTTSTITATQDGSDPASLARSITIGDTRYITTPTGTSTCSMTTSACDTGIDAARVSNTGVTPDLVFGAMAKRLRRDAVARISAGVASTRDVPGGTATCVDVAVSGGTKQYCAFPDGVLARFVGADVTVDVTGYRPVVDESQLVV